MNHLNCRPRCGLLPILAFCLVGVTLPAWSQPAPDAGLDWGTNVLIFEPSMPMAEIQGRLAAVFGRQERSQFGTNRYAYFFKPGAYHLDVNVGFYTQVVGLGPTPGEVSIDGSVHSEADWMRGNATCTWVFTRSPTKCFNAFETPAGPGIKLRHLVAIWITGKPGTEITHVINGTGDAVNSAHKKTTVD